MHKRVQLATQHHTEKEMTIEELLAASSVKAPPNTFWDDAANHYGQAVKAIHDVEGQLVAHLQQLVANEEQYNKLPNTAELLASVNVLHKDIMAHMTRLNAIYDQHKDKSGGTVTPDEHIQVININQMYADAFEIYQANILPIVNHILEQIGATHEFIEAMKVSEQAKLQEQLTDVNVVSDVEVKEIPEKQDVVNV